MRATGCAFTPQYDFLQDMYEEYKEQGLEILDFPCNQFLEQAPDGVGKKSLMSFLMRSKARREFVDGRAKRESAGGGENEISWNFTKFLVDRKGNVVCRFEPTADLKRIEEKIKELL